MTLLRVTGRRVVSSVVRRLVLEPTLEEIVWAIARALYFVSAIGAEALAIDSLLCGAAWPAYLWHVGASTIVAALGAAVGEVSARARSSRAAFSFVLVACLPLVGVLGVGLVVLPSLRRRRSRDEARVLQLSRPDFPDGSRAAAAVAQRMLAPRRSTGQRVHTLLARRAMPASAAVPGLRAALRDPSEEVRLLAHSLLDRRETRLRCEIASLEAELGSLVAPDTVELVPERRFALQRQLARLYWTLITDELAQGQLVRAALEQVCRYAEAALATRVDAELQLLLARVHLRRGDGLMAWQWLQHAELAGVASHVRAPLYAEAAFALKQFEQIPTWLERCRPQRHSRALRVHAFWSHSEATLRARDRTSD